MDFESELEGLDSQFSELGQVVGGLEPVVSAFRKELAGVRTGLENTGKEASGFSKSVTSSFKSAFDDVIMDGKRVSDALKSLGSSVASSALQKAIAPVNDAVGSSLSSGVQAVLTGLMPFARGGAFAQGRVRAFANGGIVNGPTHFPMRGGMGLMGEAGPEAIMPLERGADGRLGVRGGSAGGVNVTVNISTPDVEGFQRSRSQIAADLSRALQRGRRNL
ncbi:MAG: phage tail tape measure protein [Pseudomonadota bacterium]